MPRSALGCSRAQRGRPPSNRIRCLSSPYAPLAPVFPSSHGVIRSSTQIMVGDGRGVGALPFPLHTLHEPRYFYPLGREPGRAVFGVSSSTCLWWISSPILSATIPSWAKRWSSAAMRSSSSCDSPGRAWPRASASLPEACSWSHPRSISMNCSKVSCSGLGPSPTFAPLWRDASEASTFQRGRAQVSSSEARIQPSRGARIWTILPTLLTDNTQPGKPSALAVPRSPGVGYPEAPSCGRGRSGLPDGPRPASP